MTPAMTDIGIERKRVDDAVRTLARYNLDPFITNYLRKQPEPPKPPKPTKRAKKGPKQEAVQKIPISKYDKPEVCGIIREVLLGEYRAKKYELQLDALVEHLDELQETGRQHVYLFRLPESKCQTLRDPIARKELFAVDDAIYANGILEWEARKGPLLVRVWTDAQHLLFKWVETREYWIPEGADEAVEEEIEEEEEEDADKKTRTTVRREERAVSFFVIDLEGGNCELRIQAIRGQSKEVRLQQLGVYRALIATLLGCDVAGPVVLAPAIRHVLLTREVDIVHCSAILPNGGRFIGSKKGEVPPVDIRKLEAGVKITFTYKQPGGSVARVELDGRLDEILISRAMVPEQHRLLIERIQSWREEGLDDVQQPQKAPEPVTPIKIAVDSKVQPEPTTLEPGIDRAILEYSQTHELKPDVSVPKDPRALEQFLQYIAEVAKRENARYARELKSVRADEQAANRLYIIASVIALAIFVIGAALVFFAPAKLATGTITALLTALTGRGTWLIRSYANRVRAKRERLEDHQRDSRDTLMAIQLALSIPDPELRSKAMAELALKLLKRIT
jgi:hypothetical protein